MPAFLEQGARELSSFCLAWVDGGDTKAGGPCWSRALLWPTWENRVHPGHVLRAVPGYKQLPEKSLSLNGLLSVFPEASMDWAFLPGNSFISKRKSAEGEQEKGRRGQRGAGERARKRDGKGW